MRGPRIRPNSGRFRFRCTIKSTRESAFFSVRLRLFLRQIG